MEQRQVLKFVPRNRHGGYDSKVVIVGDKVKIEGAINDFISLTGMSPGHFLAMASRLSSHERVRFLLNHGFKKEE